MHREDILDDADGPRLEEEPEGATNRLLRNEAGPHSTRRVFREVTQEAGLVQGGWGMGSAVGDMDNDGDPDLYVSYWGPNRLYRNNGDGRFSEVGEAAGVADPGWGFSAAFGDLDGDGFVDLYVTNYLEFDLENPPGGGEPCYYKELEVYCGPKGMSPQSDKLYRNRGDGRFADKSAMAGVSARSAPAMGVVFFDYDADGDLDIYVANDSTPNLLYRNDGDWQFAEVGVQAGVAYSRDGRSQAGMGVHTGDYDNDGDLDLFVTNFSDDVNTLYRNEGEGFFVDATYAAGLGGIVRPFMGWGTGFFDFDNDGWLDLFVANGHLYPQLGKHPSGLHYAQRNLLYHNQKGHFVEVGSEAGSGWTIAKASRGAALGDYDNDGDVDLFIANVNEVPTLLRNEGGNYNNWLGLELVGIESNRDAIGARVQVVASGLKQVREVQRGYGFQSQHDSRLLFGLGKDAEVERVEIVWPSGRRQVLEAPPLRRYLKVFEGNDEVMVGEVVATGAPGSPSQKELGRPSIAAVSLPPVGQTHWTAEDYVRTGKDLYQQGRYGEARAAFEQAIELDSHNLPAYVNLGIVHSSGMGHYEEAASVLEQAVLRDSSQAEIFFLLGKVYLSLDRWERAIEVLETAVVRAPPLWEYHNWLGLAYIRAERFEDAIVALQRASRKAPGEPAPHLHLARVYEILGRVDAAQQERWLFQHLLPDQKGVVR